MAMLITCKEDYERILAREVKLYDAKLQSQGQGWILAQEYEPTISMSQDTALADLCFAYHIFESPLRVNAPSVNSLTEKLVDLFLEHIGQTRITQPWAFSFLSPDREGLIRRAKTVEKYWLEKMARKMSRVSKLAKPGIPQGARFTEGFFVYWTDLNQAFVSFKALSLGQQRMLMDPQAPSRSYLKIEEAFHMFGHEPQKGDRVIDLGAAPGGWSYSALKRGASVIAIDNGPLREPVNSHPRMCHLRNNALTYAHNYDDAVDWLLCDILESPEIILNLLRRWLKERWCRYFVVNLKVGRFDPIVLLKEIKDERDGILPYCKHLLIRQLYHDREEITLVGQVRQRSDGRQVKK